MRSSFKRAGFWIMAVAFLALFSLGCNTGGGDKVEVDVQEVTEVQDVLDVLDVQVGIDTPEVPPDELTPDVQDVLPDEAVADIPACPAGEPCDDGDPCTLDDHCGGGACIGTLVECDDTNPCTDDLCDPETGTCLFEANAALCDDGDSCTAGDHCVEGACAGDPICLCGQTEDCAQYEDGDQCNGTLFCDLEIAPHACKVVPESVIVCDTAGDSACVQTTCVPATGECLPGPAPDGTFCEDDNSCTVNDHCVGGACLSGPSVCQCEDDADCAASEDGDLCNGVLTCDLLTYPHTCKVAPGSQVLCDPSGDTSCAKAVCVAETGLCVPQSMADGTFCEDGNPCTVSDQCQDGSCVSGGSVCPCEDDSG